MTQWEMFSVEVHGQNIPTGESGMFGGAKTRTGLGVEWQGEVYGINDFLARMGADGWAVVAAGNESAACHRLYLKRPKVV